MKHYAIIDTNVLVSALLKENSIPNKILELIFDGVIVPIFSDNILREYEVVLNRPKFHFPKDLVNNFLARFKEYGRVFEPKSLKFSKAELPDPDDWKFYELLIQNRKSEETFLVTGNTKHFPDKSFIVTPRQMLEIITKTIKREG